MTTTETTETEEEDDFYDGFFEVKPRKKKRDNSKWGRQFTVVGGHGKYLVSRAKYGKMSPTGEWACSCPGWKFNRATCKHIVLIADLCRLIDDVPEDERSADVEILIDGGTRFELKGMNAVWRAELLLGIKERDWPIYQIHATSIPTVYCQIKQAVIVVVTYRKAYEHELRGEQDEGK